METAQGLQRSKIALLVDFDNVILGIEEPGFDIEIVVNALRARGVIVLGRAYGDWYRHNRHRRRLMEQGIDLIETPVFGPIIKNSADMHMALDAFEIAHTQAHIDTFCIVSGDSDFLPLIKRLQSRDKNVIVIAGHKFTSELVRRNCNEYISYENLLSATVGATEDVTTIEGAYQLLHRTVITLQERGVEVRSSAVKQMMMQLNPAFSERAFGCAQFKQFLDRAARAGHVKIGAREGASGEFVVYLPNETVEIPVEIAAAPVAAPNENRFNERIRRRGDRRPSERRDESESERDAAPRDDEMALSNSSEPTAAPQIAPTTETPTEFVDHGSNLGRMPLRRGRLRFSAREGRAVAADSSEETPATDATMPATSEPTIEVATQFDLGEDAPIEVPAAVEGAPVVDIADEEAKPKKRVTRSRKKKPVTEAESPAEEEASVEFAPQVASAEVAAISDAVAQIAADISAPNVDIAEQGTEIDAETATPARRPARSRSRSRAKTGAQSTADADIAVEAAPESPAPTIEVTPQTEVAIEGNEGNAELSGEVAPVEGENGDEKKPRRVLRRRYNNRS